MRWSENETYEFVKLYLSHEYLWNNEHDDYKLNNRRLKAYRDIVSRFGASTGISLTLSEIRSKIKNLRSTYTQELNKIKYRSGPDYTYRPTIKWFAYWHKRFKHLRPNKTLDSTSPLEKPEADSSQKLWVADVTDNLNEESHLDPFISENNNDFSLYLKIEPEDSLQQVNQHSLHKIKRKKIKLRSPSTDASDRTCSFDSTITRLAKEDEFDIYGKYIASQLRNMDLSKALRLQLEIQSLIGKARLSDV